jgi:hypothetical protein
MWYFANLYLVSTAYMHLREPGITYNPLQVVQGGWQTEPGWWIGTISMHVSQNHTGYLALLIAPQVLGSGSPSRIIGETMRTQKAVKSIADSM